MPIQLIRLSLPEDAGHEKRWETVKRISNANSHMYENYTGAIKLPSIAHKAKIGAAHLAGWFTKYKKNNGDEDDLSWTTLYRRLGRSLQLESPFFV